MCYEPQRPTDEVDEVDKRILSVIQTELPVCERPFDAVAGRLGIPAEDVLARVRRMRAEGVHPPHRPDLRLRPARLHLHARGRARAGGADG